MAVKMFTSTVSSEAIGMCALRLVQGLCGLIITDNTLISEHMYTLSDTGQDITDSNVVRRIGPHMDGTYNGKRLQNRYYIQNRGCRTRSGLHNFHTRLQTENLKN